MTRSNDDGYVTLAVLLVVGLLAAIVSSLLAVSRPALGLARLGGEEVAAEGLLEGGLTTAGFLLVGAQRDVDLVDDVRMHLDTGDVSIAAEDEAGRVDLNAADPILLEGLFVAAGGNSMSGEAFAARVVDWRDEDSDANVGGAELNDYAEAGVDYGPPNMAFHSVEELRYLRGLSLRDFDRLEPLLTVFTGSPRIDPLSASETVLKGIPGVRRRELQQLLRMRTTVRDRQRIITLMPDIAEFLLDAPSGVYRVGVEVRLKNGYSDAIEAVIAAPQEGGSDFQVVAWSKASPARDRSDR